MLLSNISYISLVKTTFLIFLFFCFAEFSEDPEYDIPEGRGSLRGGPSTDRFPQSADSATWQPKSADSESWPPPPGDQPASNALHTAFARGLLHTVPDTAFACRLLHTAPDYDAGGGRRR